MEQCKACNREFPNLMALSVHMGMQAKVKTDKKHKRLVPTPRDRAIVRKRVQGKTLVQIAKEVGTSHTNVHFTLKRLEPELQAALRDAGYGLSTAINKMVEMTDAEKTVFIRDGVVTMREKAEDNPIRFAARKEMLRIHGVGNTLDVQHSGTVTHEMTERERAEAIDVLEVIKQFAVDAEG